MINAYLKDTVTIKMAALDKWGTKTFTVEDMNGRFEFKTRLVRDIKGEQVVSSANVLLPLMTITHNDMISYSGINYAILSIEQVKDFSNKFIKVNLA